MFRISCVLALAPWSGMCSWSKALMKSNTTTSIFWKKSERKQKKPKEKTWLYNQALCQQMWFFFQTMRPHQWVKNLLLFAGLLFSPSLVPLHSLLISLTAFFLFCLLSSAVYVGNDLFDIQADRAHPEKRFRPLASGKLRLPIALIGWFGLTFFSLFLAFLLHPHFGLVAFLYILLNILYSYSLKHIVLIDVLMIAVGFVLRVMAGAIVIQVYFSRWLILCTFLLALFLGLHKRRQELTLLKQDAVQHRQILAEYSPYFLDLLSTVVTAALIMTYILYTMAEPTSGKFQTDTLILTMPFVIYGLFRYLYLVHQHGVGGSPTHILLTDRPLQVNLVLWILMAKAIISLRQE